MEFTCMTKRIKLEEDVRENTDFDEKIIKLEKDDVRVETEKNQNCVLEREIKLEPPFENVKEELLDDEYFELHVPKLEPLEESETATSSSCFENAHSDTAHPECAESEVQNKMRTSKSRRRRCQLCNKSEMEMNMKNVTAKITRLILISVFFNDYFITTARATEFLEVASRVACASHFLDAVSQLQEYLRQPQKMKILMNTVNFFQRNMTYTEFRHRSTMFIEKHQIVCDVKVTEEEKPPDVCSICEKITRDVTIVKWKVVKLVLMVGCILRGTHSIEYANPFVTNSGQNHPVCDSHFVTSMDEICKSLRIKSHHDLYRCRLDDMTNMMKIVNLIYPEMKWIQFHNLIIELDTKTGKFKIDAK